MTPNYSILKTIALVFAALVLGMHFAHVLELPPKFNWGAALYFPVQTSLYALYGSIGPILEVMALLLLASLTFFNRANPTAFRLNLVTLTMSILGLLLWASVVGPANREIMTWTQSNTAPSNWLALRNQWQYGQAAIFGLHLIGFSMLALSISKEP